MANPIPSMGAPNSSPAPNGSAVASEAAKGNEPNPLDGLTHTDLRKKLENSRKELRVHLDRKKKIDRELAALETSIYAFEGSYLSDQLLPATINAGNANTQFGNIIKGYDAYLKAPTSGSDRKRGRGAEEARDSDRMFSMSSATYQKAIELRNSELAESASEDENQNSSSKTKKRRH